MNDYHKNIIIIIIHPKQRYNYTHAHTYNMYMLLNTPSNYMYGILSAYKCTYMYM